MKLLGGGRDNGAAAAAERSRKLQQVANDRQLAASSSADAKSGATRRSPRGRRLFTTAADQKTDLS